MKKILIVEDSSNFQRIWNDRLVREGYEVSSAMDGKEALMIMQTARPDLIICDMVMPEMDGDELFEEMQKDDLLKTVPVLFMSVLEDTERIKKVMAIGARGYLVKTTTSPNQLAEKIKEILSDTQKG